MGHPYRLALSFAAVTAFVALTLFAGGCATTKDDDKQRSKAEFHYKLANNYFYAHQIPFALRELTTCLDINK
ncbi:MAG: Tfp pilus assembly protein PilF, partial [Myxococcota bacterium]